MQKGKTLSHGGHVID